MLIDVLKQVAADTGLNPVQKRVTLIELLSKGAKELHQMLECNKIYREVTLVVPRNKLVSLPAFVGEVKGTRATTQDAPFDTVSLAQPRYVSDTLRYQFNNWRDVGDSAFHTTPTITGVIKIAAQDVEEIPVTITIAGESNKAAHIAESIELVTENMQTDNLFTPNIKSISCPSKDRQFDIDILDENEVAIATLHNNQLKTRYKVIDVSKVSFPSDTMSDETLVDVLYKLPFLNLFNDSDSFAAGDDFDEPWYQMAMYFFFLPLQNGETQALTHRAAAMDFCRAAKEGGESGIVKKAPFGRNKYFDNYYYNLSTGCFNE